MADLQAATPLTALDAIVLDTETTGLDPANARLVQVGAVRIAGGKVLQSEILDELVNPQTPIPATSSAIHGISDDDVADAQSFADLADAIDAFRGDVPVIGHTIGFDLTVLAAECRRVDREWSAPRSLDTLVLARIAYPGLANYSLEAIASLLDIPVVGRHSAIGDAQTTAHVFLALIPALREHGIRTFAEAESACRARAETMVANAEPGAYPVAEGVARHDAPAIARIDSFPYRHRVRDVMAATPLFVEPSATIAEVARLVGERGTSSAFVGRADGGDTLGIVTERDLMRALARMAQAGEAPVATIMSAPVVRVGADAFVYRAIARMARGKFRHLAVEDESGRICGAVTTGDLLRQRAQAALIMGDEIDHAPGAGELGDIWSRLPMVAHNMLAEDVTTGQVTAVIASELTALTRRAGEIALEDMRASGHGEAPAGWCLLILGSGGREESRLSPDQDNALIHEGEEDAPEIDQWFEALGTRIATILDDAGVPLCKGGVMAMNRHWRHSLAGWKHVVDGWVASFEDRNLMNVDIFFDFKPVLGEERLARELWDHAYDAARRSRGFLKSLAALTTQVRSPFGIFGTLANENGRVDCKKNGLFAIVGGARALAIRHDVRERTTTDRLEGIKALGAASRSEIDDLLEAHEILSREILRQQLADIEAGIPPSTRVELARLTKRERDDLKWALRQVDTIKVMAAGPGAFA